MKEKVINLLREVTPHLANEVLEGEGLEAAEALAAASVVHWSGVPPVRRALTLISGWLVNGGEPPEVEEALRWVEERRRVAVREYAGALRTLAEKHPAIAPHFLELAQAMEEEGRATKEMALAVAGAVEDYYAATPPRSESEAARRGMEMGALRAVALNAVGPLLSLEIGLGVAQRLGR